MIGQLFQPAHLLVILVIALFVFGPKRLPDLSRTIGKSLNEFRRSMNEQDEVNVTPKPAEKTAAEKEINKG